MINNGPRNPSFMLQRLQRAKLWPPTHRPGSWQLAQFGRAVACTPAVPFPDFVQCEPKLASNPAFMCIFPVPRPKG